MDKIIKEESIEKFTVVGYSLGGRFALTTLSLYTALIDKVYLIAPDGLVEGNWYLLATGSKIQRLLFKSVLNSYSSFLIIANWLSKFGLLNKGLFKFAQVHLQNKQERDRVYNSWTCFRLLKLSPQKLLAISDFNKIKTTVILGTYDRIVPIKKIEPKLIKSPFLTLKKVSITHYKLFYYNFLDTP